MKDLLVTYPKQDKRFIQKIKQVVCNYNGISIELLESKTRKREVVEARQMAMRLAKSFTSASLAVIGADIGRKDHATVLHACRTINNLCETDARIRKKYHELYNLTGASISYVHDYTLLCTECGNDRVQIRAWIDANTKKIIDEIEADDHLDNFCPKCNKHVNLIPRREYVAREMKIKEDQELAAEEIENNHQYEQQLKSLENHLGV